ncbi:MAG: histidine--tRNA ligase [Acidobacteria bacterium]|nr:histidine--tRNA ligase [Acidobacteriota bacterium]MBI3662266.1 histidine--tRNA ligase [Acidobacteriota bacterium]
MKFQAIKGVRDILPPESAMWNRVEQTAREVFASYGYGEIRLPIFEQTELFARSVGLDTDIVQKEMYTFEDRPATLPEPRAYGALGDYLVAIDRAFETGEIPKTERNRKAIQTFRQKFGQFAAESQKLPRGFAQGQPELKDYFALLFEAIYFAQDVQLGDFVSLRPEATASVCRAYIEHGMHTFPGNVKLYYIGPMFRRERPQKGRYRQFYQIGAEVLGQSDAPAIDAEVIEMLMAFFERVGLEGGQKSEIRSQKSEAGSSTSDLRPPTSGVTLYINSIGCKECRPKYVEKLRAALIEHINELKADSQRRVETNPLRVLDSKLPDEQAVIEKLPRITDHLCEACRAHYAEVKKQLELRGVVFLENWRLVRGLDYYMRTTFEITAPGLGAQNAVCGGGRYDGLVELLGGPPTRGIGFAIGTDRLILSLQEREKEKEGGQAEEQGAHTGAPRPLDVFVAWMGAAAQPAAVKIARTLRGAGFSVEVPAEEMKFKKSIGLADKLGARYALIIGENELKEGKFALKRLSDGHQDAFSEADLLAHLKSST